MLKIILFIAFLGHVLCAITDCLLSYIGKRRIDFKCILDPVKMKEEFSGLNLRNPILSMLLGITAITMFFFGYLALCNWMDNYSHVYSVIMYISIIISMMPMVAHHIICGLVEWFYVRFNMTEEAAKIVLEFFKKTILTMIIGYIGWAVFLITFFIAVVTKTTSLPQWACIFNMIFFMILLAPTKIPAKANVASALMILGLLFVL